MENASKALLMAGGILIALLIVAGIVLMWSQISSYSDSESGIIKEEQISKFNQQYASYDRNDVLGSDVISVTNKAKNYNEKKPVENYVPYKEISITVDLKEKNAFGGKIFKSKTYNLNDLYNIIEPLRLIEEQYGLSTMQKLSSNYEKLKEETESQKDRKTLQQAIKELLGRTVSGITTLEQIEEYREYSEFKISKFNCTNRNYDNGQIIGLTFTITDKKL